MSREVGVFIGYFVIFKKTKKHPTSKSVAPLAKGPMDPIQPIKL